jgi:hypothetical protein
MGNFGEVKNSYLAPGTKMGHFSYVGDAQVGEDDLGIVADAGTSGVPGGEPVVIMPAAHGGDGVAAELQFRRYAVHRIERNPEEFVQFETQLATTCNRFAGAQRFRPVLSCCPWPLQAACW